MALFDDRKKKPQDDAAAGAALRDSLVNAGRAVQGTQLAALDNFSRPIRNAQAPLTNAARGFLGLPAAQPSDTPFQDLGEALRPAAPIPLPSGVPAASAAPVRNPAGRVPAAGAPAPAGGVAASVPPARAAAAIPAAPANFGNVQGTPLKPGDANTFTFSNGKTVPVPGMTAQATTAALNGQSSASPLPLPTPYAAAPAPTPNMTVNVPRPVVADPYNTRQANDQLKRIADTIDINLFRNSFAADRGSRSARDAQAQMLGTLAALGGKQLDAAVNVAGGDRDAAARYDLTGMEQGAANQRALLQDQGETTRQGMGDASRERQQYLQSLSDLQKSASTVTDENGNLIRIGALGDASPVLGADGKPVRPAQTRADRPDANTIVTNYTAQKKVLDDAAAITGKPADYSSLDASPLGQAYQQVLGGKAAVPAGYTLVGTTKDGKKVFRDANGKTYSE